MREAVPNMSVTRLFYCLQGVLVPVRVMKHNDAGVRVRLEGGPGLFGFVPADYVTDDVLPVDPITGQVRGRVVSNRLALPLLTTATHLFHQVFIIFCVLTFLFYFLFLSPQMEISLTRSVRQSPPAPPSLARRSSRAIGRIFGRGVWSLHGA